MKLNLILIFGIAILSSQHTNSQTPQSMYPGAWQNINNSSETICMIDGYFVYSKFDVSTKTFYQTRVAF